MQVEKLLLNIAEIKIETPSKAETIKEEIQLFCSHLWGIWQESEKDKIAYENMMFNKEYSNTYKEILRVRDNRKKKYEKFSALESIFCSIHRNILSNK